MCKRKRIRRILSGSLIRNGLQLLKYIPPTDPVYLRFLRHFSSNYTDAVPFKLLMVDPSDVQYCSLRPFDRWGNVGKVMPGEWDQSEKKFEQAIFYDNLQIPIYPSLKSHFVDNVPWDQTEFIQEVISVIENGIHTWNCDTIEDVHNRCERLDKMYTSIKDRGYLSQEQQFLFGTGSKSLLHHQLKRHTVLRKDEVAIDIGREGQLLFYDGKHRLSIAKILNIEKIPVRVVVRHQQWQDIREKIKSKSKYYKVYGDHPDI